MAKPGNPSMNSVEFRPPRWHWAIALAVVAVGIGMAALSFSLASPAWQRGVAVSFALIALLGALETSRQRVRLDDEGVHFVRNFRGTYIARVEIDSVTWAKGAGVSLRLVGGDWVKLPEVGNGSQALTNSIRTWLKRTGNGDGGN